MADTAHGTQEARGTAAQDTDVGAARATGGTATERSVAAASPPLRPMPGSGMGSRLVIGQGSGLDGLDPFPALMHDDVPPEIMFPMHQHRGVEIITYALGGALHHEDSLGNAGTVVAGGVERNLFGRGYLHSEVPADGGHYLGLQLFILLSRADQQLEPTFQLLAPGDVPEVAADGASIRVIAGEFGGRRSPLTLRNPTLYLDVSLAPGAGIALPVPADYNGIAYVLAGEGRFGNPPVTATAHQRLTLGPGSTLHATATAAAAPLRFVLIAGRPVLGPDT